MFNYMYLSSHIFPLPSQHMLALSLSLPPNPPSPSLHLYAGQPSFQFSDQLIGPLRLATELSGLRADHLDQLRYVVVRHLATRCHW